MIVTLLWLTCGLWLLGWGAAAAGREPERQPWFCTAVDVVVAVAVPFAPWGWADRPHGTLRMLVGGLVSAGAVAWIVLHR